MSSTPDPPEQSAQLAAQLRVTLSRLHRRLREIAGNTDLTPAQTSVLTRLGKGEASTASALASLEGVRPQSMAAILAPLAEAGLIERSPDPRDRRQQLITLTTAGSERFEGTRAARHEWLAAAVADRYTPDERRRLSEALTLLDRLTQP